MTEIKEKDMSPYENMKISMAIGALCDVFDLMSECGEETGHFDLECDFKEKYHIKITFEKSVK